MRLIIREYISMLKEEGELDSLIADLCLSLDLSPIIRPQKGVRQYGVDLKASGKDPTDQIFKTFLFVIKQGDLNRRNWDDGPQSVRQSLNEIFDVYLSTMLEAGFKDAPKKIVVCCNGVKHQSIALNWTQYVNQKSKAGEIEIAFWDGDKLAEMVAEHVTNETLFPEQFRGYMRKTLAFLDLPGYELRYFYKLLDEIFQGLDGASARQRIKALRLVNLCVAVMWRWSREVGNLKPAVLAAERTFLVTWDWRRRCELLDEQETGQEFASINMTRVVINHEYLDKVGHLYLVQDGLFGWTTSALDALVIEYPMIVFEQIGLLGTMGLDFLTLSKSDDKPSFLSQYAEAASIALYELVKNNQVSLFPLLDGHGIDICMGLLLLHHAGRREEAILWLSGILERIFWAYRVKNRFPLFSDSYDDLIDVTLGNRETTETSSTLLPILLEWCVVLNSPTLYTKAREGIMHFFPDVNLQLWYPDGTTEDHFYASDASKKSGSVFHSIQLPEDFDEFKEEILEHSNTEEGIAEISFMKHRYFSVGLIANRHFRTPVFPFFWRSLISAGSGK